MILRDSKITADIKMQTWDGRQWGSDWSEDFFGAGGLDKTYLPDGSIAYLVDDVGYRISQAADWENCEGDYTFDGEPENKDRLVTVRIVERR